MRQFGKAGLLYYGYARGIDDREVVPNRIRKSISAETTFIEDTDDRARLAADLGEVCDEVWGRLQRHRFKGENGGAETQIRQFQTDHPLEDATDPGRLVGHTLPRGAGAARGPATSWGHKIRLIGAGVGQLARGRS